MLRVGYIGLGLMGKSIARNILKAGFPLVVHNRSREAVEQLVAEGALPASSPAVVAAQVDIVFTNLPDSPDVEQVTLGAKGIVDGAHDGLIHIDNSTIKPASARLIADKLAARGRDVVGRARLGRRYRCTRRDADRHGRGPACSPGTKHACFASHEQVGHARGGCRRRPGRQGGQSDHGCGSNGGDGGAADLRTKGGC